MIPYERQEKIIDALSKVDLLKIEELQKLLPEISNSTLRRDLKELEKNGKVNLLTGGAVKMCSTTMELPITAKANLNFIQKDKIAEIAANMIQDGDVIYLDSGSTCTTLLMKILDKNISILTTNTDVFGIKNEIKADITILGGKFNPVISSVSGPLTDDNILTFNFQKAFIGANGIDVEKGVTTPNLVEASKKKQILKNSKEAFLLCDSTKFHKIAAVKAFNLNEVTLISDQYDEKIGEHTKLITAIQK
ncbi:DeoR/GlpR family DNA-binding transcription regulator [Enterococcus canintestini]|uniref:DeoR/GlpR family DNA-binding transcription regulator n=1 Tax=Enterococcus canintestini TaxID=317010 RepID=UPI0028904EF6|nr:DeoR/GlpR family DNA-binding transcription regulator [Enterococcus canintestini]MDT2738840.1 DeoR/GlpR family DNA-binding transcription regulator [Enterococcus canintestini]